MASERDALAARIFERVITGDAAIAADMILEREKQLESTDGKIFHSADSALAYSSFTSADAWIAERDRRLEGQ